MLWVALVEAAAIAAISLGYVSIVRSLVRQQARERELLMDKMLHLAGRTWTPPPAEQWEPPLEELEMLDTAQTPYE